MSHNNIFPLFCLLFLLFVSCKKDKEITPEKIVEVEYHLSDQDKLLFDAFSNNLSVEYSDGNNNILTFNADSIYSITSCLESDMDKGEALTTTYKCSTTYYPNYSLNIRLSARPDHSVDLAIVFGTGTYWNNQNNDYVLSSFLYNPKEPTDTINYFGYAIHQMLLDSVTLRDTTFYNTFLVSNVTVNTSPKQTLNCWYTINSGIVAFENNDGKLWVRH